MTRPQIIKTRSIDLASYIGAKAGRDCQIVFEGQIASFVFEKDFETVDALSSYECGGEVEGRKILEIRNQLFKRIKGGRS